MIILPIKMLHAITDSFSSAVDSIAELPAKAVEAAAAFSPVDWLFDALLDWRDTALTWLSGITSYGLLSLAGLWLVRRMWNRPRQDASWLRWQVSGDAQAIAASLSAQGRQVQFGGPGVLLVNAWDSGNVARALQAMGIQVTR